MKNSVLNFWGSCYHWRLLIVLGVLTVLGGIWFLVRPEVALVLMSVFFGLSMLMGGFILLLTAYFNRQEKPFGWLGLIIWGSFSALAGVFLIINLGYTEAALPYIFAFILLFQGIFNVFSSFQMYKRIKEWWIYLLNGISFLILSVIFFFYPFSSAVALIYVAAIMLIYWGISMSFIALNLRSEKIIKDTHS